jgi:hypothetical protein
MSERAFGLGDEVYVFRDRCYPCTVTYKERDVPYQRFVYIAYAKDHSATFRCWAEGMFTRAEVLALRLSGKRRLCRSSA